MRKRILAMLIIVVAVVLISAICLTSCKLISENEERLSEEVLYTIKVDGMVNGKSGTVELTLTRSEILSTYNQYAYTYIQYYGYSTEEVMNLIIESKLKNKYLTAKAIIYLAQHRGNNILIGGDKDFITKPEEVLTYAEWLQVVDAVNTSIEETVADYAKDSYQSELVNLCEANDVARVVISKFVDGIEIEFTKDTQEYLKDEYYQNQGIDTDLVKFVYVYDLDSDTEAGLNALKTTEDNASTLANGVAVSYNVAKAQYAVKVGDSTYYLIKDEDGRYTSKEFIVPNKMYTEGFDSDNANIDTDETATDSSLTITFSEEVTTITTDDDGNKTEEITYSDHTASHTFDVVAPRTTKEKSDETGTYDVEFTQGVKTVKVNRYETKATIEEKFAKAGMTVPTLITSLEDMQKAETDEYRKDGYRQVINNLSTNNTSIDKSYASSFESAVLSALSIELVRQEAYSPSDNEIIEQFKILYNSDKEKYVLTDTEEEKEIAFSEAVSSGVESLYYYPAIDNIDDYYYVSHILIKFSDEQYEWLEDNYLEGDDEHNQALFDTLRNELTVKESNPDYDADYDCPYHESGNTNSTCKYCEETGCSLEEADKKCPSQAYLEEEISYADFYNMLSEALDDASLNQRMSVFDSFVYRFNQDDGIFNSPSGYLVVPEDNAKGDGIATYVDAFDKVTRDLYNNGNFAVGDYKVGGVLNEAYAYSSNYAGIHILIISHAPFSSEFADLDINNTELVNQYLSNKVNIDGDTLKSVIKEKLISEHESLAYTDFTTESLNGVTLVDFEKDKNTERYPDDCVTINKNAIKRLYKDIEG